MSYRLGVLTTHPVQYYSAWFRELASWLDLEVFYCYRQNPQGQAAAGFGVELEWDTPLLEGYAYRWLNNVSRSPGLGTFGGCDTPEIADLVSRESLDALLVMGWNYRSALQAVWACWRRGIPVLMRGDSQLPNQRPLWKRLVKYVPYRVFLSRIDGHLFVGQRNRRYLTHYGVGENRLFFAPHCVDNEFFARRAAAAQRSGEAARIRSERGIPQDAFVLLFAGKMIPKKRPEDIIQACTRLERAGEGGIWLVFVGSGPLQNALQDSTRQTRRVVFVGFRNQSQMPAHYVAADALVLASCEESWGLVVNEAMACGLPALVSDRVGCAPDLIEEGVTGFTYPCGDIERLCRRILRLRRLVQLERERLRQEVRSRISQFSIENASRAVLEALSAVTRSRRKPTLPSPDPE